MNNLSNKQTNPVLAGCLSLTVLAVMVGSLIVLRNRDAAAKQSSIVVNQKALPATKTTETPDVSKLSGTTVTPPPASIPPPATKPIPASTSSTPTTPSASPIPQPTQSPAPTPTAPPPPLPPPPPAPSYVYKDGTYSAVGTFAAPGVTNHLNVSITISNDAVTNSTVTVPAGTDPTSTNYDNNFIANYKPYVTGKPLASLSLSKVASASLTPNGFNDALTQIRAAAHS